MRLLLFNVILLLFFSFGNAQERCATHLVHSIKRGNSTFRMLNSLPKYRFEQKNALTSISGIIRIPVVVHVIHNQTDGKIGGANNPNISDEQIESQIRVLNEDYRRIPNSNGFNSNPVGADIEIEFCLASTDPNCNPTNGITRHYSANNGFDVFSDDILIKSFGYWPNTDYLNIWVCSISGSYLGYSQFPNSANLPGLDNFNGTSETDGTIVSFKNFGSRMGTSNSGIYSYGRTVTHEIGHCFGLLHTWGDAVCGNDYCDDTPQAEDSNLGKTCVDKLSKCNGIETRNQIENYLDYSPDICMNIFTQEQKSRMRSIFATSPDRIRLLSSKGCAPLPYNKLPYLEEFENGNLEANGWKIEGSGSGSWSFSPLGSYGASKGSFIVGNGSIGENIKLTSPFIELKDKNQPGLLFDLAFMEDAVTDSLSISVSTGCNTGIFWIKSYSGKDLITTNISSSDFASDAKSWKTLYLDLSAFKKYDYLKLIIESYGKSNNKLFMDNFNVVNINNLEVNPISPSRISISADYNDETRNIKIQALFNGPTDVEFHIFDMTGKEVHFESRNNVTPQIFYINTSNFTPGVYVIKTLANNEMKANKILIY